MFFPSVDFTADLLFNKKLHILSSYAPVGKSRKEQPVQRTLRGPCHPSRLIDIIFRNSFAKCLLKRFGICRSAPEKEQPFYYYRHRNNRKHSDDPHNNSTGFHIFKQSRSPPSFRIIIISIYSTFPPVVNSEF